MSLIDQIKNGTDLTGNTKNHILLQGLPGSGKSYLCCTLPGRTLVLACDPNGASAYQSHKHIDVILTPPDKLQRGSKKPFRPKARALFESNLVELWNGSILDEYDNLVIDNMTHFAKISLDTYMHSKGKLGEKPDLYDYGEPVFACEKLMDTVTTLDTHNVIVIVHETVIEDSATKTAKNYPLLGGQLKFRGPSLFNHLLRCEVKPVGNNPARYMLRTQPSSLYKMIRTDFRGLPAVVDVTIEDLSKPQDYGFSKIFT